MYYFISMILLFNTLILVGQTPSDDDGNGFINIKSLDDLKWISENSDYWSENFELDNDIDASDTKNWNIGDHDSNLNTPDSAMGFSPIGNEENRFTGKFDGNEYRIYNLYINRKSQDYIGLFGYSESQSEISNVVLIDCFIEGNYYVGGLVGNNRSEITNCSISGIVSGNNSVGGLLGRNEENVIFSQFSGTVFGENNYTGGFVGNNANGFIRKSFSKGNAFGKTNTGGFAGSSIGIIHDCYSNVNTSGTVTVGGFIGYFEGTVFNGYSNKSVSGDDKVGGFFGIFKGTSGGCYFDKDKAGLQNNDNFGARAKTTFEMQDQGSYNGWDFENTWYMDYSHNYNDHYPYFRYTDLLSDINEYKKSNLHILNVFPNPVNDILNFKYENSFPITKIEIYSTEGKKLLDITKDKVNSINVKHLKSGSYFIKVKIGDRDRFSNFIKR